jgi:hypothetical protein
MMVNNASNIDKTHVITAMFFLKWSSFYQKYYFWIHPVCVWSINNYLFYVPDYYHYCPLLDGRHGIGRIHDSQYFMFERTFYHMCCHCPVVVYCSLGRIHLLSNPHDSILRSPLFYYFFPFVLLFVGDTYIVVFIPTLVLVWHDNWLSVSCLWFWPDSIDVQKFQKFSTNHRHPHGNNLISSSCWSFPLLLRARVCIKTYQTNELQIIKPLISLSGKWMMFCQ